MMARILFLLTVAAGLAGCLASGPDPAPAPGSPTSAAAPSAAAAPGQTASSADGTPSATPAAAGNLLCVTSLALSGSYQMGNTPPADYPGGCWPDGTWTFVASVTGTGCTATPELAAQYSFRVSEDTDYNDTVTDLAIPTNAGEVLQISAGDTGVCSGVFKLFSSDGKTIINLRPALETGGALDGKGDYRVFDADQRS
jgi:hypothetical protein